ncbi:spore protein [Oceanobacillus sp. FSL H7-0719]
MSGKPKSKNKSKKELNALKRSNQSDKKLHGPNRPSI